MSTATKHLRPLVFISYSRQDFNFAEAATATLNHNGTVDAWMDVQHLRPGMDWNKAIEESLQAADALLLIASRSALNSAYVRSEWQHALARGIPVHVALIEPVDLPDELYFCSVHDVRTQFWHQLDVIGHLIAEKRRESTAARPLPNANLLHLPGKVPWQLTILFTLLGAIAAILMYMGSVMGELYLALGERSFSYGVMASMLSDMRSIVLLPTVSVIGFAFTILIVAAGLLRRRSSIGVLRIVLSLAIIFAFSIILFRIFLLEDIASLVGYTTTLQEVGPVLSVGAISILVASAGVGRLLIGSRTIHLWLPTGESYDVLRQRILNLPITLRQRMRVFRPDFRYQWRGFVQQLKGIIVEGATTFDMRYKPADEPIANVISEACQRAGLRARSHKPTWVFIVVSSKTDWKKLHAYHTTLGTRVIFILADNVRLPPDMSELRRYQWLDFREQRPESLFSLLASLAADRLARQDVTPVPMNMLHFRAPQTIRRLIEFFRAYIVILAMTMLALVTQRDIESSMLLFCGLSVVVIGGFCYGMIATATRRISRTQFNILSAMLLFLMITWTTMLIHTYLWTNLSRWWPIVLVIILIVVLLYADRQSRYWLPQTAKRANNKHSATVRPAFFTAYVLLQATTFFAIIVALFAY